MKKLFSSLPAKLLLGVVIGIVFYTVKIAGKAKEDE